MDSVCKNPKVCRHCGERHHQSICQTPSNSRNDVRPIISAPKKEMGNITTTNTREQFSSRRQRRRLSTKTTRSQHKCVFYLTAEASDLMHLSAAIPGGLTPGTYGNCCLLSPIFGPGRGNWTAFALPRQDTRGKTRGICNITAILKMKHPDRGDWVLPTVTKYS